MPQLILKTLAHNGKALLGGKIVFSAECVYVLIRIPLFLLSNGNSCKSIYCRRAFLYSTSFTYSICIQYSGFKYMGLFETLKKIG